jgi:hypothetical protein
MAYTNPAYKSPAYNVNNDPGDLGVVVLEHAVDLPPAQLAQANADKALPANTPITIVGYGYEGPASASNHNATYTPTNQRRAGTITLHSKTQSLLQASMLAVQGNDQACFGDSGGPDFATIDGAQRLVAVSIVVNSYACHSKAWLYRVDTSQARTFLADYVALP